MSLPVDFGVSEYITLGIFAMSLIVVAAFGGFVAFLIIRKSFKWIALSYSGGTIYYIIKGMKHFGD